MTIHLIAAGKLEDPIHWPEIWHKCYNIWKSSPYKIKLWGDKDIDNLLKEDDEEFFNTLNTLNPIYKWDYIRILILLKFGGAYFDMDVEVKPEFLKSLNPEQIYISGGSPAQDILTNWIIISPKNRHLWRSFLERGKQLILLYLDACRQDKNYVIPTLGPSALTKFFIHYGFTDLQILSYDHFGDPFSNLYFAKHHFTHNWH
jgi:hypothetical protein